MSTKTVDLSEAERSLRALLPLVAQGTEIILTDADAPLARIVPLERSAAAARVAGLHEGSHRMGDDFDDALPDELWVGAT